MITILIENLKSLIQKKLGLKVTCFEFGRFLPNGARTFNKGDIKKCPVKIPIIHVSLNDGARGASIKLHDWNSNDFFIYSVYNRGLKIITPMENSKYSNRSHALGGRKIMKFTEVCNTDDCGVTYEVNEIETIKSLIDFFNRGEYTILHNLKDEYI